jgi:hypothetical protein
MGQKRLPRLTTSRLLYEAGSLAGQKINYQISGNQQRFEAVLSPQEKGIYYLSFRDPFVKDATYAVTDSPCKEYLPAVNFRMNGGSATIILNYYN